MKKVKERTRRDRTDLIISKAANVADNVSDDYPFKVSRVIEIRELTTRYIRWVVDQCEGDRDVAAHMMGITTRTIYNYLKTVK